MAKRATLFNPPPPELLISRLAATEKLTKQIEKGQKLERQDARNYEELEKLQKEYNLWNDYNFELLQRIFSSESVAQTYRSAQSYAGFFGEDADLYERLDNFRAELKCKLQALESVVGRLDLIPEPEQEHGEKPVTKALQSDTSKVFVVHGHDEAARESIARYLEQLGLKPIILHEQPNSGRTIIEKLEKHGEVYFAVVLLTPDDVGASKKSEKDLKPRARQNVILELGYFIGKLGRHAVCALHKDVELPSDFDGVVYVSLDSGGAWKLLLGRELKAAGFKVDLNSIM